MDRGQKAAPPKKQKERRASHPERPNCTHNNTEQRQETVAKAHYAFSLSVEGCRKDRQCQSMDLTVCCVIGLAGSGRGRGAVCQSIEGWCSAVLLLHGKKTHFWRMKYDRLQY
ncbi:hypothetical protein CEXT_531071 [Caerostris extrusa]|uniref:Uncharacterized protein n=1 Tax=Caerostris extrusa TaxID=172846 RepID=A0AAV4VNW5_CAEEX|nr:hypothetical protein CEXT_531071 [Caerostris extrusa]